MILQKSIFEMEESDIKLRLFSGYHFHVNGIGDIAPIKLRDVVDVGVTSYNYYLYIISLDIKDIIPFPMEGINVFDLIINSKNDEIITGLTNSLKFFLKEDLITPLPALQTIIVGENSERRSIKRNNYLELKRIIEMQNCVKKEVEAKYSNQKAKEIAEKLKKGRSIVEKYKNKNQEDNLTFYDIISEVSTKSNNISKFNILDLTIYQLYDEFKGIRERENRQIELSHWASKID